MSDILQITDFLSPINKAALSNDCGYAEKTIGKKIHSFDEEHLPDLTNADLIIIGCGEQRGNGQHMSFSAAPDAIRQQLYQSYLWHDNIQIADAGNLRKGATLADTYAALKTVINELTTHNKTVLILGGSHDLTLAQYYAFAQNNKIIEAANVDALIDLNEQSDFRCDNFLMEMLTGTPNFIRHYNHIGFQSYYVHPGILETLDKLHFDCYRVGHVKEMLDEMEPVMRSSHLLSFDITALAHAYAPANTLSPNGFSGEEACTLMRYAGMSSQMSSIGMYGYDPDKDFQQLTAKQISQMIWYLMDGISRRKREAPLHDRDSFTEFHLVFSEVDTLFLKSKKTGRWWMQLPDGKFIACSYKDYLTASSNEIPERWLRAQARS